MPIGYSLLKSYFHVQSINMALKLYMVLLGAKPKGRHTEQHDVFLGLLNLSKN